MYLDCRQPMSLCPPGSLLCVWRMSGITQTEYDGKHHLTISSASVGFLANHNTIRAGTSVTTAGPHRGVDVQQAVHDFPAGTGADRRGA